MSAECNDQIEFPKITLDSAVLFDFDDLVLAGRGESSLSALAEHVMLLHRALDGAALIVSGLTARDLDAALAPLQAPMLASMGWERRWHIGETLDCDELPTGVLELHDQLTSILGGPKGSKVVVTPSGVEVDLTEIADNKLDVDAALRRVVASRPGFRMLSRGWRYQIMPSNLRKDHLIQMVINHPNFRNRQLVHIADNTTADDAARLVRRRGGVTIRVAGATGHESNYACDWSAVLGWLSSSEILLSTARWHADGFDD